MELLAIGIAVVTGFFALYEYVSKRSETKDTKLKDEFMATRRRLRGENQALVERRLAQYKDVTIPGLHLIGKSSWIFDEPMPLDAIEIELEPVRSEQDFRPLVERFEPIWPRANDGTTISNYSEAVREHDAPTLWSSGTDTYRLVDVDRVGGQIRLRYELASYHDSTDTQEAIAFAFASGQKMRLDMDPFDFRARCASTSIDTLTLVDGDEPRFLFHIRDGNQVGQAPDQFHVVPAGEFEPSVVDPDVVQDFDLWNNIQREFAEEFLGLPDGLAAPLDDRPEPDHPALVALDEERGNGDMCVWTYGLGLTPLSFKPELLTVAVFNPPGFERIFADLANVDHEGTKRIRPFTEEQVERLLGDRRMNPVAHAILKFAWRDRDTLLPQAFG